jgi:hypothetical protein
MRVIVRAARIVPGSTILIAVLSCALLATAGELPQSSVTQATAAPATLPTTQPLRRRPAAPPATAPSLPALPGTGAQQSARNRIRDIYAAEYANPSYQVKRALARKLIEQADQTKRDSDAKFMLYREARDVAAAAGDVPSAFEAVNRLSQAFPVVKLQERLHVLEIAVPLLNNPHANAAVTSMCLDLLEQCVVENDYERAEKFLELADQAAAKTEKRAYVSWVQWRQSGWSSLRESYELARPAENKLKRSPDDRNANLTMGKFVCLVRKDWDVGLPMLLKGSDKSLAALAERDLQCPDDHATSQFAMGDAWWNWSEREEAEARRAYRQRAAYWYRRALSELDGLDRATAERRILDAVSGAGAVTVLGGAAGSAPRIPRPPDVMPFGAHFYRVSIAEVPWETAVRLCEEAGGRLVCLETRLENDYVVKLARGRVAWLGATLDTRGRWNWISNTPLFFSYWATGQPDLADPCARTQMGSSGAWQTSTTSAGFVCEWDQ